MTLYHHKPSLRDILWGLVPFMVMLGFIFLSMVIKQLPMRMIYAPLPIIPLFYWAVFRSNALSLGAVFIIGLILDFLSGVPIGAHAFIYVLVFFMSKNQRRFLTGQGFLMMWVYFLCICLGHQILLWLGYLMFHPVIDELWLHLMISGAVTAALLPIFFPLLTRINIRLDRAEAETF